MKLINKIKNKLFPEEKEILYYENKDKSQKENRFVNKPISDDLTPINYRPDSFSNTQEISDSLKNGNVVVVDVSLLNKTDALRMIDFLGGVMYALNGDMKRLNKTTFEFSINKS
jgi:cell division inhibitor SepF